MRWTSIFSTHHLRPTCDQMNDGSQKTSGRSKVQTSLDEQYKTNEKYILIRAP